MAEPLVTPSRGHCAARMADSGVRFEDLFPGIEDAAEDDEEVTVEQRLVLLHETTDRLFERMSILAQRTLLRRAFAIADLSCSRAILARGGEFTTKTLEKERARREAKREEEDDAGSADPTQPRALPNVGGDGVVRMLLKTITPEEAELDLPSAPGRAVSSLDPTLANTEGVRGCVFRPMTPVGAVLRSPTFQQGGGSVGPYVKEEESSDGGVVVGGGDLEALRMRKLLDSLMGDALSDPRRSSHRYGQAGAAVSRKVPGGRRDLVSNPQAFRVSADAARKRADQAETTIRQWATSRGVSSATLFASPIRRSKSGHSLAPQYSQLRQSRRMSSSVVRALGGAAGLAAAQAIEVDDAARHAERLRGLLEDHAMRHVGVFVTSHKWSLLPQSDVEPLELPTATLLEFVGWRMNSRYSRVKLVSQLLLPDCQGAAEDVFWFVHTALTRPTGTAVEQAALLQRLSARWVRLSLRIVKNRDRFFEHAPFALAAFCSAAFFYAMPASRTSFDDTFRAKVLVLVVRIVSGVEVSPHTVLTEAERFFPDEAPVKPAALDPDEPLERPSSSATSVRLRPESRMSVSRGGSMTSGSRPGSPSRASVGPDQVLVQAAETAVATARRSHQRALPALAVALGGGMEVPPAADVRLDFEAKTTTPHERQILGYEDTLRVEVLRSLPPGLVLSSGFVDTVRAANPRALDSDGRPQAPGKVVKASSSSFGKTAAPTSYALPALAETEADVIARRERRERRALERRQPEFGSDALSNAQSSALQAFELDEDLAAVIAGRARRKPLETTMPLQRTSTLLQRYLPPRAKRLPRTTVLGASLTPVGGDRIASEADATRLVVRQTQATPWGRTGAIDTFHASDDVARHKADQAMDRHSAIMDTAAAYTAVTRARARKIDVDYQLAQRELRAHRMLGVSKFAREIEAQLPNVGSALTGSSKPWREPPVELPRRSVSKTPGGDRRRETSVRTMSDGRSPSEVAELLVEEELRPLLEYASFERRVGAMLPDETEKHHRDEQLVGKSTASEHINLLCQPSNKLSYVNKASVKPVHESVNPSTATMVVNNGTVKVLESALAEVERRVRRKRASRGPSLQQTTPAL
jgi:hypothetical protein